MFKIMYGVSLLCLLASEASSIAKRSTEESSKPPAPVPAVNRTSISDQMAGEESFCPSLSLVRTSKHTEACRNLTLPSDVNVTVQNVNEFLCAAVWHQTNKICSLKAPAPKQPEFDATVGKFLAQHAEFPVLEQVCSPWKANETFRHEKTQKVVDFLAAALRKDKNCMDFCVENEKLNPLCVFVYFLDQVVVDQPAAEKKEVQDVKVEEKKEEKKPQEEQKVVGSQKDGGKELVAAAEKHQVDAKAPGEKGTEKVEVGKEAGEKSEKLAGKTEKIDGKEDQEKLTVAEKVSSVLDPISTSNEDAFPSEINFVTDSETTNDDGDDLDVEMPPKSSANQEEALNKESGDVVPRLSHVPKEDDDSHFFGYFSILGLICGMGGCVLYHHKQKVLAILLEGRRSRGGRGRRRPSTANYRKLDCTLEEAVTSQCNSNATNVIY